MKNCFLALTRVRLVPPSLSGYGGRCAMMVAAIFIASAASADIYLPRLPGAKIVNAATQNYGSDVRINDPLGSCNRWADPTLDGETTRQAFEKSCIGQNINRENFSVRVAFDPKMPILKKDGTPWTAGTLIVPGPPSLPKCNTVVAAEQNALTCNETVCPIGTPTAPNPNGCSTIATISGGNGVNYDVAANLSRFAFSNVGSPVFFNISATEATPVYFSSITQKYPTSGIVKSPLYNTSGAVVTTKCQDASGYPVESSTQPTSSSMTCSTGTPMKLGDGSLIANAVPVMVNVVFTTTVTKPAPGPAYSPISCVSGNVQNYALNKLIVDKNCNPQKDINLCKHENKLTEASCDRYLVGGADMYDANGVLLRAPGSEIMAAAGTPIARQVAGSLYNLVFNGNSMQLQNTIMALPGKYDVDLRPGVTTVIYPQTLINFEVKYEGSQACVYAYERDASERYRVEVDFPLSLNEVYGVLSTVDMDPSAQPRGGLNSFSVAPNKHCVPAPPATVDNNPLVWNNMVSPICTKYQLGHAQFPRPFTSVVVECIEDTLMGIFYPQAGGADGSPTFFSMMQDKIKATIRLLMALYLIFFGFKLMTGKEAPKKQDQWMWIGVKIALVTYFAIGSGMVDLLPSMFTVSKELSIVVMEAGLGVVNDSRITAAQAAAAAARTAAIDAHRNVVDLSRNQTVSELALARANLLLLNAQLANALNNKNTSKAVMDGYADALARARADLANMNAALATLRTNLGNDILAAKTSFAAANASRVFNAAGTNAYKTPSFCTRLSVELWGGGAAGKYSSGATGRTSDYSGGAGGYVKGLINTNAGASSYAAVVGSGGASIGASGGNSSFSTSTVLFANGGRGIDGGTAGGTASISSSTGGVGNVSTRSNGVAGGNPSGGTGQSATACQAGGSPSTASTSPGGGGCSADDGYGSKWGVGAAGKAVVECANFDFTNLNNVDATDQTQVTFRDNLRSNTERLQLLQGAPPESAAAKQAEIDSLAAQLAAATAEYNANLAAYNEINSRFAAQLLEIARLQALLNSRNGTLEQLQAAALAAEELAIQRAQELRILYDGIIAAGTSTVTAPNTGYSICDFRFHQYPSGKEYLKLWDMIDCRFSKYLGIGDNEAYADIPQVLIVSLLAPISVKYGIPIFFFGMIFLVIVIMIIARVVHIYIIAFVAVILLVFISPLVIPAVFFEFTKSIFTQWMQQLLAYLLQPVILFAFLSFMFACIDTVMFGGNHTFSAGNKVVNNVGEITSNNTACGGLDPKCHDAAAVGYIFQTIAMPDVDRPSISWNPTPPPITSIDVDVSTPEFQDPFTVDTYGVRVYRWPVSKVDASVTMDPWPDASFNIFNIWHVHFGDDDGKALFIGLSKLMLIVFVVYSILTMVEGMAVSLVSGALGGASGMTSVPVLAPHQVMKGAAAGVAGVKDAGYAGYEGLKGAHHAAKHYDYKGTAREIKRGLSLAGSSVMGTFNKMSDSIKEGNLIAGIKDSPDGKTDKKTGVQATGADNAMGLAHQMMRDKANHPSGNDPSGSEHKKNVPTGYETGFGNASEDGGISTGGQSEEAKSSLATQQARAAHKAMVEGNKDFALRPGIDATGAAGKAGEKSVRPSIKNSNDPII